MIKVSKVHGAKGAGLATWQGDLEGILVVQPRSAAMAGCLYCLDYTDLSFN